MSDLLEDITRQMRDRLEVLRPVVAEFERVQAALEGLERTGVASRPANGHKRAKDGTLRGRPAGGGPRFAQALEVVRAHPGLTISQISERMGIGSDSTYLYRVLPRLEEDGLVFKAPDRTWHPVNGKATVTA